ncbi:hypothetical protein HMPREF1572_00374 [Gardnerella vaginalis JCP7275]|nr:hypothetical protein HMPREF1572_00374 [Gardnerella vaginalis JCP7275]
MQTLKKPERILKKVYIRRVLDIFLFLNMISRNFYVLLGILLCIFRKTSKQT